ncbi:hypothetical protein BDY19DRAFT_359740 [Irpex rosettiformis]|uniref:Uncharacterized protein n=1 Tax=Irpex rosettiformis TaxID=378272 RepID=A0ACB8TWK3_9APHY|nr:hypothetical protein BDY19DRAFT_359740 [Irpex rosettiformis]
MWLPSFPPRSSEWLTESPKVTFTVVDKTYSRHGILAVGMRGLLPSSETALSSAFLHREYNSRPTSSFQHSSVCRGIQGCSAKFCQQLLQASTTVLKSSSSRPSWKGLLRADSAVQRLATSDRTASVPVSAVHDVGVRVHHHGPRRHHTTCSATLAWPQTLPELSYPGVEAISAPVDHAFHALCFNIHRGDVLRIFRFSGLISASRVSRQWLLQHY